MEDMYMHQPAKGEPNWFTDGAVISANVHTHFPPIQTPFFTINLSISYLNIYLFIYISRLVYKGERKFPSLQTSYLTPIHTSIIFNIL